MCDIFGNKCYEQKMLKLQMDYQTECGCYPGCNSFQYTPLLEEKSPKESDNINLINIKRSNFLQKKKWDIETPGDWSDHSFLKNHARDKFLTRYVLDFFKGILNTPSNVLVVFIQEI